MPAVNSIFLKEAAKGVARNAVAGAQGPVNDVFTSDRKVRKAKPGEHWSNPLQEQHPDVNRTFIMNLEAATPETMGRALAEDFEVKHRGGLDFSIRKPGEKKWKVVDPDTWADMIPFWKPFSGGDWSDIAGDLFTGLVSGVGGAVAGTAGFAGSPAGSIVAGAKGAALGAAGAESFKQALGKLLGGHATLGEAGQSIATEAVLGGVGEAGARALAPALKMGKRALLGNVDELIEPTIRAERAAAKEAAGGAGPVAAQVGEEAVEGFLPKVTKTGEVLADDIALHDVDSVADLLKLKKGDPTLKSRAAAQGIKLTEDVPAQTLKDKLVIDELDKSIMNPYSHRPIDVEKTAETLHKGISKGDKEALEEAARLGVDIPEPLQGTFAKDVLKAETDPAQRAAIERQVDRKLAELSDYEPVEIEHILSEESAATGAKAGDLRTYKGPLKPDIDPMARLSAQQEIEGMTLEEAQTHLTKIGWQGQIPDTLEEVADKVYANRHLGSRGGVDKTASQSLAGPFHDPGSPTPWHKARKDAITEIRAGGETFRPGRGAIKHPRKAAAAKAVAPFVKGIGGGVEKFGQFLSLPAKAGHAIASKIIGEQGAGYATRRALFMGGGIGAGAMNPALLGVVGGGIALDLLGQGVSSIGRKLAAETSGQALVKLASAAPEKVARKLFAVVERLQKRGVSSYRAGIYAMMHDPEVRYWLSSQDVTKRP